MADEKEIENLKEELDSFKKEKEKIRKIMESVGGSQQKSGDRFLNGFFIITIILLFTADISRHLLHLDIPLPSLFSIELGVLLVSMKIIWMIHKQTKVEHFQFWILNSIEFRVNEISKRLSKVEEILKNNNKPEDH
ncbi:MAG: hypothetical protein RBT69_04870 [Spirochaetia bacterium]|jgi:hypothetical protein|nr:hypothetical protein [Spirochaetia bacterium]